MKFCSVVRTDNVDILIMTENTSLRVRTGHISTRYHFIRERLEVEVINICLLGLMKMIRICFQKHFFIERLSEFFLCLIDFLID